MERRFAEFRFPRLHIPLPPQHLLLELRLMVVEKRERRMNLRQRQMRELVVQGFRAPPVGEMIECKFDILENKK